MPLQATSGAASYDAFGGGVSVVPNYIEEVFSTWLYTGNSSTQTITNGIDLSTKGGLVWLKSRAASGGGSTAFHLLSDTARGITNTLSSNSTLAQNLASTTAVNSVSTTGFVLANNPDTNLSGVSEVSWTFREQPKFFDVLTYTGNGTSTNVVSHTLASQPAFIITKRTDSTGNWIVWHRTGTSWVIGYLNTTGSMPSAGSINSSVTSTQVDIGSINSTVGENANISGATYVMYLFAHNAGGFGLTGTDNVISCGSYTGTAGVTTVNVGFEPQWLMIKKTNATANWKIVDNMRGFTAGPESTGIYSNVLVPNLSDAEAANSTLYTTSTGFNVGNYSSEGGSGNTFIYIAIRRGQMKVPTTGTSVFGLSARSGTGANATVTGGQTDDVVLVKNRGSAVASLFSSRLTGTGYLVTSSTAAQVAAGGTILQANPWDVMDGVKVGTTSTITNASANTYINYLFKRAPSFMDVVCWTGDDVAGRQINHNLVVQPELLIMRSRTTVTNWYVNAPSNTGLLLDTTQASNSAFQGASAVSNTTFTPITDNNVSSRNYIAYLFATCAGVSKVGSYTGNGTTQTIDCGITAGARFVLIKRTDSTGDWYVYDTARGMTVLTDPYWLANTTAAEVATLGSVTTVATGFALNSTILAAINVNAGTYIFLAIA